MEYLWWHDRDAEVFVIFQRVKGELYALDFVEAIHTDPMERIAQLEEE